ncbi:MAG TPA: hypothetical protein VFQ76_21500 [Longimicrobiaceae bacterium]|nr:hypothetical protein [Longimicrobiaceae bacterium]
MASKFLARIKPYNPGIGALTRTYVYKGKKYLEREGWYEVSPAIAQELEKLRSDESNPRSQRVFDVAPAEVAAEMDAAELLIEEKRPATRARPEPVSTHKPARGKAARVQGGKAPRAAAVEPPKPVAKTDTSDIEVPGLDEEWGDDSGELGPPAPGGE